MIISGYDCWKRKGLSRRRKLKSVGAETTSSVLAIMPTIAIERTALDYRVRVRLGIGLGLGLL